MEFFIDDEHTESIFQEVFKKVLILRNGESYSEMKKYGLNYQKSLGVTIVNLRELAKSYQSNHLLAHKLWTKAYRETKILASLLEEEDKVTLEQIERWFTGMDSTELVEQVSVNLWLRLPSINTILPIWLSSENYRKVLSAIIVIGRLAMQSATAAGCELEKYVELIPDNIDEFYLRNHVKRTLGKMVRVNKKLAEKITRKVNYLQKRDENWQEVWDDLQYELKL